MTATLAEGRMASYTREPDPKLRCRSKWAGCRCHRRSGHAGFHWHDGAKGTFEWNAPRRKRLA